MNILTIRVVRAVLELHATANEASRGTLAAYSKWYIRAGGVALDQVEETREIFDRSCRLVRYYMCLSSSHDHQIARCQQERLI